MSLGQRQVRTPALISHHRAWLRELVRIVAGGGADRRSAKIAEAPLSQSREAHHAAWPLHSRENSSGARNIHPEGDQLLPLCFVWYVGFIAYWHNPSAARVEAFGPYGCGVGLDLHELGVVEVCLTRPRASKIEVIEGRLAKIGIVEARLLQIDPRKAPSIKFGKREFGVLEVDIVQTRILEVGGFQLCALEVDTADQGVLEVAFQAPAITVGVEEP
jgi:hypothetical protein